MYASIDFATKNDLRLAVHQGTPIALYSPALEMTAVNGIATTHGPWPFTTRVPANEPVVGPKLKRYRSGAVAWTARVVVKDGFVVKVLN